MPKSKKAPQKNEPPEDTQKLYARAYALRLAKQVGGELENSRRKAAGPKKRDGKG
jgi:hypothetical protein